LLTDKTATAIASLRAETVEAHRRRFGSADGLLIGLQLTHSGRFSRPNRTKQPEPVCAYRHPILDAKFPSAAGLEPISDAEVGRIVEAFATSARLAANIGFDFVDLKHCHGYLGHEFLSAFQRPGPYGGAFENRTRFLRELVAAVRAATTGLLIAVRISSYDSVPYVPDPVSGRGVPSEHAALIPYRWGFGVDQDDPCRQDLAETERLLALVQSLGVTLVNITAGSPYYSPHLQRPALFPPCDAYAPPEDPLAGAARLLAAARDLKAAVPGLVYVSSGWSYFQEYLPHFAQGAVRAGWVDFVGLGRMMLSYPDFPADILERGSVNHRLLCRTFSDCTNGPRNGFVSGCYPLDALYRARPEAAELRAIKLRLQRAEKQSTATETPGT
jgi:2,4-dienoyl-CoA reductase-like NADH-dependent reductase (Old Yellow Enzyme family)